MSNTTQSLQQVQRIIAVINNMQKLYNQSSEVAQQRYINQAKQFLLSIQTIQQNLKIDDPFYQETSEAINQANDLINDFTHPENKELEEQRINETTKFQSQLSTTMNNNMNMNKTTTVQMAQTSSLTNNIQTLRNQINSIQNLINQTTEEADFTFQEQQNRLQTEDISSMAITKLKAQTKAENQILKQQVSQLQQDLNIKVSELKDCKQQIVQLQSEKENFQSLYTNNKIVSDKIKNTLQSVQQENKLLQEELTKIKGKYENNLSIQKIDQENIKREKQQLSDELIQITAEREMLQQQVQQLQQQLAVYNQTDIETASNEIESASKKILQLQTIIEQMRKKQEDQKEEYLRTINGLKTTIAALTEDEELLDDQQTQQNQNELMQQNKQLQEQVQTLTQQLQQSNMRQTNMMQSTLRKSSVHGAADKLLEGYKLNQSMSREPLRANMKQSTNTIQQKQQSIEDIIEESRRQ